MAVEGLTNVTEDNLFVFFFFLFLFFGVALLSWMHTL